MLSAASDGERTIRLPRTCSVVNAFTGEAVARQVGEFSATARLGETIVWKLIG